MTGTPRAGSLGAWVLAARPRTLTASVAPVVVGSALAVNAGAFRLAPALAALVGALLIQVGTNLTNDVADFHSGADTPERLGPTRAVQAGLLSPKAVAAGAGAAFGLAALIGLYLVWVAGTPILVLGLASIAAGILYTAGPFPLAHRGLGDVFVLLFFGVAAVAGTFYVQAGTVTGEAIWLGLAVGALADAILTVNNLRDIETDRAAGKRTLAVRIGARRSRMWGVFLVALAFTVPAGLVLAGRLPAGALVVLLALPSARAPVRRILGAAAGSELNLALAETARLQLLHAALLAAGLAAS